MDFGFDASRSRLAPGVASVASDEGWVTMHGPKIEHRRRQGELTAAMACGGGTEQLADVAGAAAPAPADGPDMPALVGSGGDSGATRVSKRLASPEHCGRHQGRLPEVPRAGA